MLSQRIRRLIAELGTGLHEKEELIRLLLLSVVAEQNVFLFGPPGVAKSMLARRIAKAFRDSRSFEYLLGRFTTPDELFGPVSIKSMKDADKFERVVDGFLPDAHIVFLDEIWNASSPILNTLLTAINEHRFRNGSDEIVVPLRSVVAASKTPTPEDAALENLWDRFLLRLPVRPVTSREAFRSLISQSNEEYADPVTPDGKITMDELDEWHDAISAVTIPDEIEELIYDIRERINRHNSMTREDATTDIIVSDRRWKQAARLLRASAFLNDRTTVDAIDCLLLRHCLWGKQAEQETIETIVGEATRRFLSSGIFDSGVLREELQKVLADAQQSQKALREDTVDTPVSYRGEYYRVTDFVDDHLSLIWIGDFQNLDEEETRETDLFFYGEEDEYAYSERFHIRRVGSGSIEIDGVTFDLEHETITKTVQDYKTLTETEKDALREKLNDLILRIGDIEDRAIQYRDVSSGEAERHLFVHRSYAEIVVQGMDALVAELSLIKADVDKEIAELR